MSLPAGTGYQLRLGDGTTAAVFDVHEDGTLDFAPEYDAFLDGRGGHHLTVRGVPVDVDARALDHPLTLGLPGAVSLPPDRVHSLRLLPAAAYRLRVDAGAADGYLDFSVTSDGQVELALDGEAAGIAEAAGSTLRVQGRTVTVDGRSLSHSLLPVGVPDDEAGVFLSPSTVHRLTLLPAIGYAFHAAPGVAADFSYTVRADGTVDYDASCDRFLTGRGTRTLVVGGFPVALSAAGADSDLLGLAALDGAPRAPRELAAVLAPAAGYQPRTAHGVCTGFDVARDGTLKIAPASTRSYGHGGTDTSPTGPDGLTTLTVRIVPALPGPPPRGSVTFTANGAALGTVPLDQAGLATLRAALRPAQGQEILAVYEGDDAHQPSAASLPLCTGPAVLED
ncbi:Ig-like domain-containing protein [Streptomyces sp. NPDC015684]|uniref:Ig-like domain-containing protein n=1 Tax=unclassified Streptomyces TaxID=2593676 RepID=UPI0036F9AD54